jgi:hypothetical protein
MTKTFPDSKPKRDAEFFLDVKKQQRANVL